MTEKRPNPHRNISLELGAKLIDVQASDSPEVSAYVFSTGGKLLGLTKLTGEPTKVDLAVGRKATALRVLIGPSLPGKSIEVAELLRLGAIEKHLRVEENADRLGHNWVIDPAQWRSWFLRRCRVRGTLTKRVTIGDETVELPVCHATVDIWEVDPIRLLIPKLPNRWLEEIRDLLIPHLPFPTPFPGLAARPTTAELREALLFNPEVLRPYLYLYPFITKRKIGEATTDDCGHFQTWIYTSIFSVDTPDLYFTARQSGTTILEPRPVAAHTWWNYTCGTEVSLTTEHPLAVTCAPCGPIEAGDNWVLFMAIGNHPLSRIHLTGTGSERGLTSTGAPWGGLLRPRLEFDNSLRDVLDVRYYRMAWKRANEPDTSYRQLSGTINRHYAHWVAPDLVIDAYPLGPTTVGGQSNLFEIPPTVPPLGQWSQPDVVEDTASGKFDTVVADGSPILDELIDVRVELFDSSGNPVDIATRGIRYFVPTSTDLSGTVETVDAATLGLVSGNTMVVRLHVNNERCTASIAAPTIANVGADPCCGVLQYQAGSQVTMAWTASQPHGFASFSFNVKRGTSVVYNRPDEPVGGSTTVTLPAQALLDDNLPAGCVAGGCRVAGFGEHLYVSATATNGWSRQAQYDAPFDRAFVLDHS